MVEVVSMEVSGMAYNQVAQFMFCEDTDEDQSYIVDRKRVSYLTLPSFSRVSMRINYRKIP